MYATVNTIEQSRNPATHGIEFKIDLSLILPMEPAIKNASDIDNKCLELGKCVMDAMKRFNTDRPF